MDTTQLPPPAELVRRIDSCKAELRALTRLLHASKLLRDADEARARREPEPPAKQTDND
jgi:hypothetical protein